MSNYKYVKSYRERNKARGQCLNCAKPVKVEGERSFTLCDLHLDRARDYERAVRAGFRAYKASMSGKA